MQGLEARMKEIMTRESDCAAVEVCEKIGNARKCCYAGSQKGLSDMPVQICMVSLILLSARAQGLIPDQE